MYMRLVRISTHPVHGTFGVLTIDNTPELVTLEPYKRNNEKNISCIPTGQYICKRYSSEKYKDTFEVAGVQGRSHILFHTGNTANHTEGCVVTGERFGVVTGMQAVCNSRVAMARLLESTRGVEEFTLTICESW